MKRLGAALLLLAGCSSASIGTSPEPLDASADAADVVDAAREASPESGADSAAVLDAGATPEADAGLVLEAGADAAPSGNAVVNGSIGGHGIAPAYARLFRSTNASNEQLNIYISTSKDACRGTMHPGDKQLIIQLSAAPSFTTASYRLGSNGYATFFVAGSDCHTPSFSANDGTGSVVLSDDTTQGLRGTFDVQFGSDHVTGLFGVTSDCDPATWNYGTPNTHSPNEIMTCEP